MRVRVTCKLLGSHSLVASDRYLCRNDIKRRSIRTFSFVSDKRATPSTSKSFRLAHELSDITTAAELSWLCGLVYHSNPESKLKNESYIPIASAETPFTRYLILDKPIKGNVTNKSQEPLYERHVITRGVAWGQPGVDSPLMWRQLSRFWPTRFSSDLAVHSGIFDMAKDCYSHIKPFLLIPNESGRIASFHFCGHSLGGSIALLLMLQMELEARKLGLKSPIHHFNTSVYTFGSPPVLAPWDSSPRIFGEAPKSVGNQSNNFCRVLESLNLPLDCVKSFVLDKDIIARSYLSSDPLYKFVVGTNLGKSMLNVRERVLGNEGIFSKSRFLFQPVGVTFHMVEKDDEVTVGVYSPKVAEEVLSLEAQEFFEDPFKIFKIVSDHNHRNYSTALSKLVSSSKQ